MVVDAARMIGMDAAAARCIVAAGSCCCGGRGGKEGRQAICAQQLSRSHMHRHLDERIHAHCADRAAPVAPGMPAAGIEAAGIGLGGSYLA
eukprot:SAG31_NODE_3270_length_4477_cov_2.498401_1_plen_91_part_00